MRRLSVRRAWLCVALVVMVGCGASGASTGNESPTGDGAAFLACSHFRDVANDVASGLLTDAELRTKLQEVYHDAQFSEEPGVADEARAMLAAITSGNVKSLKTHFTSFANACLAVGY